MKEKDLQYAHDLIRKSRRIVLVSHPKPDGDTTGSLLAMSHYLVNEQKDHECFCVDELPERYAFLPGADRFTTDRRVFSSPFDLCITLDGGDLRYLNIEDEVARQPESTNIINIDHHCTNEMFGHANIVDTGAASTADVLYRFFEHHRVHVNKDIATCLLTGILTDTGNFSNKGTTSQSMSIASELLGRGARFNTIVEKTVANQTLSMLKLWGRAFERLRRDPATGCVSTAIFLSDFQECNAASDDADGVSNFLNSLENAKHVLFLRELPNGMVKGGFRTSHDDVDVSKIARDLGGGGHAKAAGFTVRGSIQGAEHGWSVAVVDETGQPTYNKEK